MSTVSVVGGSVLVDGELHDVSVTLDGAVIDDVGGSGREVGSVIDASGCLVLPAIVDVHGDAFERSLMPRPGVSFDVNLALADAASQLAACGVTTGYLAITDSFEPGLRSRATLRLLLDTVAAMPWPIDLRVHVRHEVCATNGHDELLGWLAEGRIDMLSINDHAPGSGPEAHVQTPGAVMLSRTGLGVDDAARVLIEAARRREEGHDQVAKLAAAAHEHGMPLGSHDPATLDDVERDRALGVGFAEFPLEVEVAHAYRAAGVAVVLGAPNVVRGGSHLGGFSAADAARAGAVDALCSDYHYPSMLHAPFRLVDSGHSMADAWSLVSNRATAISGLTDRGTISPGARADLAIVEPPATSQPARVRALVCGGRVSRWA
jgi:alpha-D-ribose 1-methylphosphonate 5-triphosphate diphosphatase